jgi:hypothetical protein
MYDIVFISYGESNAEHNWNTLVERFPNAKRVDGVNGIHAAHEKAAKKSLTKMFWVVDADAEIVDDFDFTIHSAFKEIREDTVYTWRSINPVNGLMYGYGGVKLLPKKLCKNLNKGCDVTTSISDHFQEMPEISNITRFNSDSFSAWRSGFRECVKLASRAIDRQKNSETEKRLQTWCNVGTNARFGIEAITGANQGKKFGEQHKDNPAELERINDFEWLKEYFEDRIK